jgi:serine protease Do
MRLRFASLSVALGLTLLAGLPSSALGQPAPADKVEKADKPPVAAPGAVAEARKLSDAFVSVAERVSPAVVQIDVTAREEGADQITRFFGKNQDSPIARGTGSGVIFTTEGAILTNNHVIDHALTINVRLRDGRLLPAKLLGRDPATDLAVIKIEGTGFTAAKFADSDNARVGEWTIAIGSPFGLGYTVTTGVLSAKGRGGLGMNQIEDYLQTDASINPGNSGGPLCDLDGRVLGINTMIVGKGTGIGFAVPSNLARRAAEQIVKNGHVQRSWIGVGIQDLTPELASAMKVDSRAGVLVNAITDGGPAAKANLKAGDIIGAVAGKKVIDGRELVREVIARGRPDHPARDRPRRQEVRHEHDAHGPTGSADPAAPRATAGCPAGGPRPQRPRSDGSAGLAAGPRDEAAARHHDDRARLVGRSRRAQAR